MNDILYKKEEHYPVDQIAINNIQAWLSRIKNFLTRDKI
jgi:hypothetical protein